VRHCFGDQGRLSVALLERARKDFMRAAPILNALGCSPYRRSSPYRRNPAAQIRDAQRELLALDRDGDGQLEPQEIARRR
jgi:hypothetical protein